MDKCVRIGYNEYSKSNKEEMNMRYTFDTTATMKPYNNKKWYICGDIVRRKTIEAKNLSEALKKYQDEVTNKDYITISDTALKRKSPMFIDTIEGAKQVGYVITGSTDFDDNGRGWVKQYIELWVTITQSVF